MTEFKKLSILIPVYNERATILRLIDLVKKVPLDMKKEIIITDDGSTDGTADLLRELGQDGPLTIHFHDRNRGKGAALKTCFQSVSGDIVVIQDADLEYDPEEYKKLLEPILTGKADVVYGSRFHAGPRRVLLFWHYLRNQLLTLFSNFVNNLSLTDEATCYKMFKRGVLDAITIRSNRFTFDPEFAAKIARKKFKIYEVPISYHARDYSEGKKIRCKDGISALFAIIWFRFFD